MEQREQDWQQKRWGSQGPLSLNSDPERARRCSTPSSADTSVPTFTPFLSESVARRYGNLPGVLHMIELEKGKTGLGLSLAGNRDRSRMSVFVVGIDPGGAAGRDGRMTVGDELLEVRR